MTNCHINAKISLAKIEKNTKYSAIEKQKICVKYKYTGDTHDVFMNFGFDDKYKIAGWGYVMVRAERITELTI